MSLSSFKIDLIWFHISSLLVSDIKKYDLFALFPKPSLNPKFTALLNTFSWDSFDNRYKLSFVWRIKFNRGKISEFSLS